jgi:pilus assembly protein CpaE
VTGRGAIRALVITAGPGTAPALTRAVELAPGVELAGEVDAMRALAGLRPACDAFLVVGEPAIVRELAAAAPGIPAVLVGGDADGQYLRLAMSAGARGVVPAEPRPEELAAALLDAIGASAPAQERRSDGRVIAVCAAKGGVGATTVAVGMAAASSGMLVDAAAGHGTLAGHLGCHPQRSLADLARLAGSVGAEAVAAVRTEHPSGLGVVAGLSEPDLVGLLPSGLGAALARECRSVAGTTVFDLGRPGSPFSIETARCTDNVVLVLTPDALAATAAAATIGTLVRRGVDPDAVLLVVNRWRGGDALPLRAIEATAGARVLGVVGEDADGAGRFSNAGAVPPVKRRGLGRDLTSLAERLAG